ncbi:MULTISPECIES: TonB-dependent receptor [Parabacteroides]|uniref:TonB-dependent receptor n=1 Tax=Parabacteroides leei TaxID=2939491 RepID=UPI001E511B8A|nr:MULTISPECIES: TonB-dependent receptor [Parabacteroides]MCL3853588.1 TonB-dependent receptor [Parabacteroides leei]
MRFYLLFLIVSITQAFGSALYSQSASLTLRMNDTTIEDVLNRIEEQTEFRFLYNKKIVDVEHKVNVSTKNGKITDVLDHLFKDAGISYTISDRQIVLNKKDAFKSVQQSNQVTGIVTDANGDPIIGANVIEKGTTNGIISDLDGKFTINVNPGAVLQVSYIGYITREIIVKDQSFLTVKLSEDTQALNEVVVVGYGIQRKVTTTGAVTKLEGDDLNKMTVVNVTKALQGLSPGITIVDRGGAPGSDDPEIYLRGVGTTGNANPLVLVDGIEMSLSQIPSAEIENISVLKDAASASIYGSRAAHGVILVTTKRGKEGKVKLSYDGSVGFQDRAVKAEQVSAREYMTMVNEALINAGGSSKYSEEDILATENGSDPYKHSFTNWPNEVYKSNYITQHTLNLTGGSEVGRYLVSFDYLDQPGLTENTEYKRYSYRVNTDLNIGKMLKVSSDVTYRHIDRLWPEGLEDAQYNAWSMQPTTPNKYENGDYVLDKQNRSVMSYTDLNVVGEDRYNLDAVYGQVKADFEPIKDLIFTGMVSINGNWDRRKIHYKNHKYYNEAGELITQRNNPNSVKDERNNDYQMTMRFLANYKKRLGDDHDLSFLYGMEQISYRKYYSMAQRKDLISDELPDISLGSAGSQFAEGKPTKWGINSYFGRINYGFKDKYLFEANIRADGSSRFAKGHKWGVFPSFSAAWRISEEAFMKNLGFVDNLKLRASWGQTGNERIDAFMYLPQYNISKDDESPIVMNGSLVSAVYQKKMANPDVTWETVEQTNIGLDFSILNNSIYGELDWYTKDTKDILLALGIPKFIGLDAPEQNAGVVRNSGVEAMIGFRKTFGDVSFNTSVNLAYNKNEWIDRGGDDKNIDGYKIQHIGSALNSFYIYQADGLIANEKELEEYKAKYKSDPRGMSDLHAGDVKLVDTNGDGTIDPDDRQIFTSNIPKFTYGWNIGADYKGFDLSLLFQGSSGANRMMYGEWIEGPSYEAFTGVHFRDRWTEDNQNGNASMPRLEAANNRNASTYNSFFLQKVNYLRLKNVQLGYTFPTNIIDKLRITKLRLYVSGSNLFTVSSMDKGLDPEDKSDRLKTFPPLRIINFGVNIIF